MGQFHQIFLNAKLIPRLIAAAPYSLLIVFLQSASGFFSIVGIPLLIPVLDYLKDGSITKESKVLVYMQNVLSWLGVDVTFGSLLTMAGILFLLSQVLLTVSTLIAVFAQAQMAEKYRNQLVDAYGKVDWPWLVDSRTGEINFFALRESDMASVAHANAQRVVIYSVQFLVLLVIAIQLSLSVTVLAVGVYAVIASGNMIISKKIIQTATKYHGMFSKLSNDLIVLQQNKKFFKTSLLNVKMTSAIKAIIASIANLTKRETSYMEYQRLFGMVVTFIFLLTVMYLHRPLMLDYSALLVVLFVFSRMAPNFSQLTTAFATLDSNIPAYHAVQQRLNDLRGNEEPNGKAAFDVTKIIRFEKVSFSYPNGKKVFDGMNLVIEPKRTTVILGPSGSGKSTLLDLLLGLLKPTSGSVYYGDARHDELDKNSLRCKVSYVSQETTLVEGTLGDNLSIRLDGPDAGELKNILAKTGLDKVVESLPQGLATPIGENGIKLSGGQRQRIALARALLTDPQILILDEATSNLDLQSESAIMETIKALKKEFTVLIVTHRTTSVGFADKIYTIENNGVKALAYDKDVMRVAS